jgi:hypothetical protein
MSDHQMPAGWYPDNTNAGQLRFWDGTTWTDHTAPVAGGLPPISGEASLAGAIAHAPAPNTAQESASRNWFLRHKVFSGVLGVLILMMIIGALSGGSEETDQQPAAAKIVQDSQQTKPSGAVSKKATPSPTPEPEPEPSQQDKFLDLVQTGQEVADGGNEIAIVQAGQVRGKAICALLGQPLQVKNWTGSVEEVSTELGGDNGVLAIEIGNDVSVQTWNNSFSDIGSGTMIAPSSDLFGSLAELGEDDEVTFSGKFVNEGGGDCIQEQSLMDESGMTTPDFSFEFASVKKH